MVFVQWKSALACILLACALPISLFHSTSSVPPNTADNIPRDMVSVSVINAVPSPSWSDWRIVQVRFSVACMKARVCEVFCNMLGPSFSHIKATRWRINRFCWMPANNRSKLCFLCVCSLSGCLTFNYKEEQVFWKITITSYPRF